MSAPSIGIDYLPAVCHPPGIGRYLRELVRALVRRPDCPRLSLCEVGRGRRIMEGAPLGLDAAPPGLVRRRRRGLPRRLVRYAHERHGLGADSFVRSLRLFHRGLPDYPPIVRTPEVLPIPELPPEDGEAERVLRVAARRAAAVVVFSEDYARRVAARLDVAPERITHTPVGCEHWLRDARAASGAGGGDGALAPRAAERPRILVLGAMLPERGHDALVRGFDAWSAGGGDAELCFIGGGGAAEADFRRAVAAAGARKRIHWLSGVLESQMPALVSSATLLVHLGGEIGTPVTPLEAMAMGLAVAASPRPALREALGDEAVWIHERRPAEIAEALEAGLRSAADDGARARRRAIAERFTWDRCAARTLDAWRGVLGGEL